VLDQELLAFVRASIRSTWALELLLMLRKTAPQDYAADELVRALRATPTLISTCLDQLQRSGLVVCEEPGRWRYAPAAPALDLLTEKLGLEYGERPVAVISAIVASPNDRLKNFSDAFRFPKKDD
jgi:hypothetical protein